MYIIVIKEHDGKFLHFGTFSNLGAAVEWVRKNGLWERNWYPEEIQPVDYFSNLKNPIGWDYA